MSKQGDKKQKGTREVPEPLGGERTAPEEARVRNMQNNVGIAIWPYEKIDVRVHTHPDWHPFIAQTIEDYNNLSSKIPRLVPRYGQHITGDIKRKDYGNGVLVIVSHYVVTIGVAYCKVTKKQREIHWAKIVLSDWNLEDEEDAQNTICHEMLHALTWAGDGGGHPESCLHGLAPHPNQHDKRIINQTYKNVRSNNSKR